MLTAEEIALNPGFSGEQVLTPCQVEYGQFELPFSNPPGQKIADFTLEQLQSGKVAFIQDGGFQAPTYKVRTQPSPVIWESTNEVTFNPVSLNGFQPSVDFSKMTANEGVLLQGLDSPSGMVGYSLSIAGDINNDGIDDFVIGNPNASPPGKTQAGVSYVIFGSKTLGATTIDLKTSLNGNNGFVIYGANGVTAFPGDQSGWSVGAAGDINDDGVDDLVIGDPGYPPGSAAGAAFVIFGAKDLGSGGTFDLSTINGVNGFIAKGWGNDANTGSDVSGAGDLNHDGIDDLVIGAMNADPNGIFNAGICYVLWGSKNLTYPGGVVALSDLNGVSGFAINSITMVEYLGYSVNGVGDINDDGIDDLAIGGFGGNVGRTYVIFGSEKIGESGVIEISALNGTNGFATSNTCDSCGQGSGVGDLNKDGISDLGVGGSYVIFGARNLGAGSSVFELSNLNGSNGFYVNGGAGVITGVGDVNSDGIDDFVGSIGIGKSYVKMGEKQLGSSGVVDLSLLNGTTGYAIKGGGGFFTGGGDFNSDGIDDWVTGENVSPYHFYGVWGYHGFQLLANRLPIISGGMVILSQNHFNVSSNGDEPITFSLDQVNHGQFELVVVPGSPIMSFTMSQLAQNQIRFVHDGSTQLPEFTLQINQGFYVIYTPGFVHFNARPTFINNSLWVIQGALNSITPDNLWATDRESPAEWLTYTVSNVRYGQFEFSTAPSKPMTQFFAVNITDGTLFFRHDGSILPPTYTVAVSDGVNVYAVEGIVNFDHLPELVNNQLFVNQGQAMILNPTTLSAKSSDHPANSLIFLVDTVQQGQFNRFDDNGTFTNTNITQFGQQEIIDQRIAFLHDGSNSTPAYRVAVSDGLAVIPSQPAVITFNHAPLLTLKPFPIDQGRPTVISPTSLSATDIETPSANLLFTVSDISCGQFEFTTTPGFALTEFLQLSVMVSSIQFVNNGSENSPTFAFSVSDGQITTTPQAAEIQFNHQPGLNRAPNWRIKQSQQVRCLICR